MIIWYRKDKDNEEEFSSLLGTQWEVFTRLLEIPHKSLVVARYSVLPFYQDLEKELEIIQSQFINSYRQHRYVADIGNWYSDLKDYTPKTWFEWGSVSENSYVVKGRTNSRKFQWNRQMFCPTKKDIPRVLDSLMDDSLVRNQGFCIREYIPLRQFDIGINGLPITNEWRVFCLGEDTIAGDFYWSNYLDCKPYSWDDLPKEALQLIEDVKKIISKRILFYVIDIAETKQGDWIVIELNDGQMSGLSAIDPQQFYKSFYKKCYEKFHPKSN